jgi:hypothetical protein
MQDRINQVDEKPLAPHGRTIQLGQSRRSRRAERRRTLAGERHHPVVRRSLFNRGVMLTRKG